MQTRCWSDLVLWKALPRTEAHVRLLGFQFFLLYWRTVNTDSRTQLWVWSLSLLHISVTNLAKVFSFVKPQLLCQLNIYNKITWLKRLLWGPNNNWKLAVIPLPLPYNNCEAILHKINSYMNEKQQIVEINDFVISNLKAFHSNLYYNKKGN